MNDSDDEGTTEVKRPRDKFELERSDLDERSRCWAGQDEAKNAGWERGQGHQRNYNKRNFNNRFPGHTMGGYMQRRPSDSLDRSPYIKRPKTDSDDRYVVSSTYNPALGYQMRNSFDNRQRHNSHNKHHLNSDMLQKPKFSDTDPSAPMSFAEFLIKLEGDVDETEAVKKYEEYKSDLCQTKVEKFFDKHKDEEWFRVKYHPEDRQKRINQQTENMKARLEIFRELLDSKYLDNISLDIDKSDKLVNLMDAIVLKLEGETDDHIKDVLKSKSNTNGHINIKQEQSSSIPKKHGSIVLSNLSSDTTKEEVLDLCKRHAQFIRVCFVDPQYEGSQLRRKAFITFNSDVDLKEICWKLNKFKIRNCEIEATINREITKRVRQVNGITSHKKISKNDLKHATNIILNLDEQRRTWEPDEDKNKGKERKMSSSDAELEDTNNSDARGAIVTWKDQVESAKTANRSKSFKSQDPFVCYFVDPKNGENLQQRVKKSKNPLLNDIGLYLVEESSGEEEELLGNTYLDMYQDDEYLKEYYEKHAADSDSKSYELFERSEDHIKVLDKLLLYLRIVHSFDYYNYTEYRQEDEMPNRLGIMHVRGPWPPIEQKSSSVDDKGIQSDPMQLPVDAINKYISDFDERIKQFSHRRTDDEIPEEQCLVMKYFDVELNSDLESCLLVDKSKTSQVYECKHCTRKFEKKMEFFKSHIVTKHKEATAVIMADVEFFNSYLFDPNRLDPVPPKEEEEVKEEIASFVIQPAPRGHSDSDPRAANLVSYDDISFDEAI